MQKYLFLIIGVLCAVSCQVPVDFSMSKSEERLVLYAFPTENDTLEIQVSASSSLDGLPTELNLSEIYCATNTQEDTLFLVEEKEIQGIPLLTYKAVGKHQVGDTVSIRVGSDSHGVVRASTVIPSQPAIDPVHAEEVIYKGERYVQLRVGVADCLSGGYYAVRVVGRYVKEPDELSSKEEFMEIETSGEPLLNNYTTTELDFGSWNDFYHRIYLMEGKALSAGYTLHLNVVKRSAIEAYKVQFMAISESYYKMLKSINDLTNNDLGGYGLSFISSTYTNVSHGFGCVGGYSMVESGWIETNN